MRMFMDPVERSQIHATLAELKPKRLLEWGSGGSTVEFLERHSSIERLVSIEHHPAWFERVRANIRDERLSYHLMEASEDEPGIGPLGLNVGVRSLWRHRAESRREMFADYVDFPKSLGLTYDCVFIDGRARRFCIEAGWELLEPGGVMIIHDAHRKAYHAMLRRFGRPQFLNPWRKGQVCLMRKEAA